MKVGNTRVEGGILLVAAGVVLLGVFAVGFYLPASQRRQAARQELADVRAEVTAVEQQIVQYHLPDKELVRRRRLLAEADAELQAEQDRERLMDQLSQWSKDMPVQIMRYQPTTQGKSSRPKPGSAALPPEPSPVQRRQFAVAIKSTYRNLFDYLTTIERLPGPTHVSRLALHADPAKPSPELSADLTVCVYANHVPAGHGGR